MKKQIETPPEKKPVLARWTAAARGEMRVRRLGKPKGELNQIIRMAAEWSKIPNTLFEDAAGQLWLAFTEGRLPGEIDKEGGFEAVNVETALEWLQAVSEFTDGYDGDIADVCRIALAELARRPKDPERVQKAMREEGIAEFKLRPARAAKRIG